MPSGPKIADSRNPDRSTRGVDARGGVFENANVSLLQGESNTIVVKPTVVVAENGNDAGWRTEVRQLHGNDFGRNEPASNDTSNDQVPEDADEIGSGSVGTRHRLAKFSQSVER